MKQPKTQKEKFAVMTAQESLIWRLCSDFKWPAGLKKKYREFQEKLKFEVSQIPEYIDTTIQGFEENNDISHYDIDKAVKKKFGDKISTDSESGQFYAYCNETVLSDIIEWLGNNYPTLVLEFYKSDNPRNPYFENWTAAEHFCKENEFEVVLPNDLLDKDILRRIDDINIKIQNLNLEKESLLNTL